MLVEAKAHDEELKVEGRRPGNAENHDRIGAAIREASDSLKGILAGWNLPRDSRCRLANRFAYAGKMASLGIPVILVHLGFLCADEMSDEGPALASADAWADVLRGHARGRVPDEVWGERVSVRDTPMRALIRSVRWDLPIERRP